MGQRDPEHYRLSWGGEVTTPEISAAVSRGNYLMAAEQLYPALREELLSESKKWRFERPCWWWELPDELRLWVSEYCKRWKLIGRGGGPVYWALEYTSRILAIASIHGFWPGWAIPSGAVLPPDSAITINDEIIGPKVIDLTLMSLAEAKRRLPRRLHPELRRVLEAYKAAGFRQAETKWNPYVYFWAARHQVGGESWAAIAKNEIIVSAVNNYDSCLVGQPHAQAKQVSKMTVKYQGLRLLRELGLGRAPETNRRKLA